MSTVSPLPVQFHIISQVHSFRPMPDGTMKGEWTITFETPSGVQSEIIIPDAAYTRRTVGEAIAHQTRTIEEVHALTEHTPPQEPPPGVGRQ